MSPPDRIKFLKRAACRPNSEDGAVLLEFALISFVLYLLIAALTSMGGLIQASQVAQDVARLAARELSLTPLPATMTFEQALDATSSQLFDPNQLVVDLEAVRNDPSTGTIDAYFAQLPLVNRALRPVFVFDQLPDPGSPNTIRRVLRFPGAPLLSPNPTVFNAGWTVGVPTVTTREADGEVLRWLPVVEEIRPNPNDPTSGPFSALSAGTDRGLVALRVNIPATAAGFASYDAPNEWPPAPNAGTPHAAGSFTSEPGSSPPFGIIPGTWPNAGPQVLGGEAGLGVVGSLGQPVRPFRKVFLGQALFRREVYL